jgi:hypothetical protein
MTEKKLYWVISLIGLLALVLGIINQHAPWGWVLAFIGIIILFISFCWLFLNDFKYFLSVDKSESTIHGERTVTRKTNISSVTGTATKTKSTNLTLDSVSDPASATNSPNNDIPSNSQILPSNQTKDIELSDLEKTLNHVKIVTDQINELTRQIKLAEKNKTDAVTILKQKNETLEEANKSHENELQNLRKKLQMQSSSRALISIKKFCEDLSRTQKIPPSEEALNLIIESINQKLSELDIHTIEFLTGRTLASIPGEQVDISAAFVPTEDSDKNNTVARTITPCYYTLNDSNKIIICKAVVSLFRFTQPITETTTLTNNPTSN